MWYYILYVWWENANEIWLNVLTHSPVCFDGCGLWCPFLAIVPVTWPGQCFSLTSGRNSKRIPGIIFLKGVGCNITTTPTKYWLVYAHMAAGPIFFLGHEQEPLIYVLQYILCLWMFYSMFCVFECYDLMFLSLHICCAISVALTHVCRHILFFSHLPIA